MSKLETAKATLQEQDASCVAVKNDVVSLSHERGIKPIVQWLAQDETFFKGAYVADKVIGRAAALLLVYGGVKELFAGVLSEPAAAVLAEHGVAYEYGKLVPHIINRTGDDMCPMERRALSITLPEQAYETFKALILK
ncbi:DUF1893 domain-containing protein [Hydrogenoanaerobacterium sp.]|uniref:DUF1893 domain-containing protein n=1 Tax=Hydrogenoanaerobacterium sp. TaxID=2953763 RepID=UPI0028A0A101|nr:DUF1893 domain-containing protein [Hydrogenoanaerobacterium sp.]